MKKIILLILILILFFGAVLIALNSESITPATNELGTPFPTLENVVNDRLIIRETEAAKNE